MTSSSDQDCRHTGDPRIRLIERELRRGNYLKGDDRTLKQILEDDAAVIAKLKMNLQELTDKMQRLFAAGCEGFGDPIIVDQIYEVKVEEYRGSGMSPWLDHCAFPKVVVSARNLKTGKTLKYSLLSVHLIRHYGFFQGLGSPFRIDPRDLHEFFENK